MNSIDILRDLIAFPTVSADPNRALIDHCATLLRGVGADVTLIEDDTGTKANLFATVGPRDRAGVLLSGHTDVVPIAGQNWTKPAFELTQSDGRLYGRGTTDMKGFVACALSAAMQAASKDLTTPLHLALSYDEEIGCVGVRSMIDMLSTAPFQPKFCIVGEPTHMAVATGHKGKTAGKVRCTGREGHSALAPMALNAIYLAQDMIAAIRALQSRIAGQSGQDAEYDVPYSTLHVGTIFGGTALNIVPNLCEFAFEFRNIAADSAAPVLDQLRDQAAQILAPHMAQFPEADIQIDITNSYPALGTANDADVVRFVQSLTGANGTTKVAFGTEGGLFDQVLGIPTVICGPGSMAQGHKPDEFIAVDQIVACDRMIGQLVRRLIAGL